MSGPTDTDPTQWILVDTGRLSEIGTGLLDILISALGQFPDPGFGPDGATRADGYTRLYVAQGQQVPIQRDREKQMTVSLVSVFKGLAGEQLYQYPKGALGREAYNVARFEITMARPWVTPRGSLNPTVPNTAQLDAVRDDLWQDAWIVWNCLTSVVGGQFDRPWSTDAPRGAQMQVGPMIALAPAGAQAGFTIQFDTNPG